MTCQNSNKETYIVLLTLMLMTFDAPITLYAERNYLFEFGPKVGISIFAQDPIDKNLTPHLAYGGDLRYKFDTRWAVCAGVTATDIRFTDRQDNTYKNNLIMVDAKGEFNFFKLNRGWVDRHSRSWSPYLMAGLGISIQTQGSPIHGYMPFGFGLKWKMAERLSFNVAWQANWFFSDAIEGADELNDPYGVTSNMLDNDLINTFYVTLTLNLWRAKSKCFRCGI